MTTKSLSEDEERSVQVIVPLDPALLVEALVKVYSVDNLIATHDGICQYLSFLSEANKNRTGVVH